MISIIYIYCLYKISMTSISIISLSLYIYIFIYTVYLLLEEFLRSQRASNQRTIFRDFDISQNAFSVLDLLSIFSATLASPRGISTPNQGGSVACATFVLQICTIYFVREAVTISYDSRIPARPLQRPINFN